MSTGRVPAFLAARAVDPRLPPRPGAARRPRRVRRIGVRGARAAPLPPVAVGRRRHRRRQAAARHRDGRALARRPHRRRRVAGARRRARRRVAHQDHRRAGRRARLPHVGRARPLPRRDPAPGRMGHGAPVARRRGREPHGRGGRRPGTRRAGWRRRSSAPRPRATRSTSTPSGSRTRWSSWACPTRRTSGGPDRRCRSRSSAPTADPAFLLGDAEGTLIASIRPGGRRHPGAGGEELGRRAIGARGRAAERAQAPGCRWRDRRRGDHRRRATGARRRVGRTRRGTRTATAIAALGRAYLRRHPHESHAPRLLRQLPDVRSAHAVRPQLPRLTSTIVADFDTGRVVNVDGWELARTEARAAAAIALGH